MVAITVHAKRSGRRSDPRTSAVPFECSIISLMSTVVERHRQNLGVMSTRSAERRTGRSTLDHWLHLAALELGVSTLTVWCYAQLRGSH